MNLFDPLRGAARNFSGPCSACERTKWLVDVGDPAVELLRTSHVWWSIAIAKSMVVSVQPRSGRLVSVLHGCPLALCGQPKARLSRDPLSRTSGQLWLDESVQIWCERNGLHGDEFTVHLWGGYGWLIWTFPPSISSFAYICQIWDQPIRLSIVKHQ